jgi:hypothetical protein
LRTLYVTGLTTSALAFLGGMGTCAAIIWMFSSGAPEPSAFERELKERAVPTSVRAADMTRAFVALSEEVPGVGVRFPGRCGEGFGASLGCLTVREAQHDGERLGVQAQLLDGCTVCTDLGLQRGDIITHIGHGTGQRRRLSPTPDMARWLQHLPAPLRIISSFHRDDPPRALTLRILRDGRPALLTRGPPN